MPHRPSHNDSPTGQVSETLLRWLREHSGALETDDAWVGQQFAQLARCDVTGWVVPVEFGGQGWDTAAVTAGYEQLACACLTTTFVLTQQNGACQRILLSPDVELKQELLEPIGRGEQFATVGISHLTTSRQHLSQPALQVEQVGGELVFDGVAPWVTGASHADWIVAGGTCADGRQVLAAVSTSLPGVTIEPPAQLMALQASQTGAVRFEGVRVNDRYVLSGPVEQVLRQGSHGGAGSLTTSALAIGAARRSIEALGEEAARRAALVEIHQSLERERTEIAAQILAPNTEACCARWTAEEVRQRANSVVLRAAQACLAATKGRGFIRGHLAERLVREAMFFLVWSCPQPVVHGALREFACLADPEPDCD